MTPPAEGPEPTPGPEPASFDPPERPLPILQYQTPLNARDEDLPERWGMVVRFAGGIAVGGAINLVLLAVTDRAGALPFWVCTLLGLGGISLFTMMCTLALREAGRRMVMRERNPWESAAWGAIYVMSSIWIPVFLLLDDAARALLSTALLVILPVLIAFRIATPASR